MATFIKCKFATIVDKNPEMVNLDLVQKIKTFSSWGSIDFYFSDNEKVSWHFESIELKEKEYARIVSLIAK